MRLLLIAPFCDGEDVGEPWVTYQWVRRLAERHRVTVVTCHKRGRRPLTAQLPGTEVVDWPDLPRPERLERLDSMLKPGYPLFHRRARQWIRQSIATGSRYDLIHQLCPVALRYPSPGVGAGLPLVIGPVGGSLPTPAGFEGDGGTNPWYVGLRRLDQLRLRADPYLRRTFAGADCVIGIAPYVRELLGELPLRRFEVMGDTGIEGLPPDVDRSGRAGPVRFLYVGRVVRTKGVRDAIAAFARMRGPGATSDGAGATLDVVGDGFDRPACEELIAAAGLQDSVRMLGRLDHARLGAHYRAADVFVFPSYREAGGIVVAEAMAHGLPLIVADRGGPAHMVTEECGIRVPVDTPGRFVGELAAAMERLTREPRTRVEMGNAGRNRVARTAIWDNKVTALEDLYRSLLERPIRTRQA